MAQKNHAMYRDVLGRKNISQILEIRLRKTLSRASLLGGIVQLLQLQLEGQPHGNVFPAVPSAHPRHRLCGQP